MSVKSYEEITKISGLKAINEGAYKSGNIWKVKTTVDVPVAAVNAFIKKVKEVKGPDSMDMWSQTDVAEMMATYVMTTYMNVENVPVEAITGENKEQPAQILPQPIQTQPVQNGEPAQTSQPIPNPNNSQSLSQDNVNDYPEATIQ